jgi:hypothetical protein
MVKSILPIALIQFLLCLTARGGGHDISPLTMGSPKLNQFLLRHPQALAVLTNQIALASSNRTVKLIYYYTGDEKEPRAFHYYPSNSVVCIGLRENQAVLDEFVCCVFEIVNSRAETHFKKLMDSARLGEISKSDFVQGLLKIEFQSAMKARDLIRGLKFKSQEAAASCFYPKLVNCPDDFEGFLDSMRRAGTESDRRQRYEQMFDALRTGANG